MKTKFKITGIQLFHYSDTISYNRQGRYETRYSYSAHLIINDKFIVQAFGNENECGLDGIAGPIDVYWKNEDDQTWAQENVDQDELEADLEESGFENNVGWLEDWPGVEIMNPENRQQ